jgi:hypothetical protein
MSVISASSTPNKLSSSTPTCIIGEHRFILVDQRNDIRGASNYYNLCTKCGIEKVQRDSCVIDISHQHDYKNYSGCNNGFHILRCTYLGCDSMLRLFNLESRQLHNHRKHMLEE